MILLAAFVLCGYYLSSAVANIDTVPTVRGISDRQLVRLPIWIHNSAGQETAVHEFIYRLGEHLPDKLEAFYRLLPESSASDRLVIMREVLEMLKNSHDATVRIDYALNSSPPIYRVFFASPTISFRDALKDMCDENTPSLAVCQEMSIKLLHASWPLIEPVVRAHHWDVYLGDAQRWLQSPLNLAIINLYVTDKFGGPGIGHVLKGLINAVSVHFNSKVLIKDNYILGNYADILDSRHVISLAQLQTYRSLYGADSVEDLFTWRIMVTREEELTIKNSSMAQFEQLRKTVGLEHLNSAVVDPMFSPLLTIDYRYDRCILPSVTYVRIMKAVRSIKFTDIVTEVSDLIIAQLRSPSLGVSVRSFRGPHEAHGGGNTELVLKNAVESIKIIIRSRNIRSVLIAFDNPQLREEATTYLAEIAEGVSITYTADMVAEYKLNDLQKAAVELVSLSQTSFILGLKNSSFVELAYYLGGMMQDVYFLPPVLTSVADMPGWLHNSTGSTCLGLAQSVQTCYDRGTELSMLDTCVQSQFDSFLGRERGTPIGEVTGPISPYVAKYLYRAQLYPAIGQSHWHVDVIEDFCASTQQQKGGFSNILSLVDWRHKNDHADKVIDAATASKGLVRILCIIYTTASHHNMVQKALLTWGRDCTGMLVFSNETDLTLPSTVLEQLGGDTYENLWQKIVSLWKYVHQHHADEFDWFYLADDDTYLIYENLEHYLSSEEILAAKALGHGLYMGQRYKIEPVPDAAAGLNVFNSGGPGYMLDQVALGKLGAALLGDEDICLSREVITGTCDRPVGQCMKRIGIAAYDTRDHRGLDRFHHFHPAMLWTFHYTSDNISSWWKYSTFRSPGISTDSISFHWIKKPAATMEQIRLYMSVCRPSQPLIVPFAHSPEF